MKTILTIIAFLLIGLINAQDKWATVYGMDSVVIKIYQPLDSFIKIRKMNFGHNFDTNNCRLSELNEKFSVLYII